MKDNVISIHAVRGIPTPRYRAQRIRQDQDQDLFVNLLANHEGHLARSKAKAQRVIEETMQRAEAEARAKQEAERFELFLGGLSVSTLLALTVGAALIL